MRLSLIVLATCLTIAGCKKKEEIARDIPPRSAERLIGALESGMPTIDYYSAKAGLTVELADDKKSVTSQIRSVRDSALWVSVVPALGIEVARVLITKDSLKVIERINDKFFLGTISEGEKQFGASMDIGLFEQALKGIPIGLNPDVKYRSDREAGQYVLTSKGPKKFVRLAEELNPLDTLNETPEEKEARRQERLMKQAQNKNSVISKYWIDPETMLPTRVLIADLSLGIQADVHYRAREEVHGSLLPSELEVFLSDQSRDIRVEMELSRIKTDGPLKLSFRVPDKYEPFDQ